MKSVKEYITHPKYILISIMTHTAGLWPDKLYLKIIYYLWKGKKLNLKEPITYNEKLQWLKLNDRDPLHTTLVDKIEVKKWVAKQIGEEYVIPTLGVWNDVDSIDLISLPDKFVIKTNHDSGGLYICKDKTEAVSNWKKISKRINNRLKTDYYLRGREYPYKNVSRKIFAEKLLDSDTDEISDYKFFCFDGVPQFLYVATDRQKKGEDVKFDFFDINFNWLPIKHGHENAKVRPQKPINYEAMVSIATKLSKGLKHVRIDLYNVNGKIYFGEMTFFNNCGFLSFNPSEWDIKFGQLLKLPTDLP